MREIGLTRVRSMGPVAAAVEHAGGSVSRVFRRADVPLAATSQPDLLIPLRDQLRVVEYAAREIDDPTLPARLSLKAGVQCLGPFGSHVQAARDLRTAIARCNDLMGTMLQSATRMQLITCAGQLHWTYGVTDSVTVGRQTNELLALGYMVDLLRHFLGATWQPLFLELSGAPIPDRQLVQHLFGCEIRRGERAAAVIFASTSLGAVNRVPEARVEQHSTFTLPGLLPGPLPGPSEFVAAVEHVIMLGLVDHQRAEAAVCRRLRVSDRSLQRLLAANGSTFKSVLRKVLFARATTLLRSTSMSITDVAFELGYSDAAHFTRAFAHWAGESPSQWRRRLPADATSRCDQTSTSPD